MVKALCAYIMVNATKGLFISCDVPMAQFIVSYNASLPASQRLFGVEILLKSKIEKCEKHSDLDRLDCKQKIVVNLAVPSRSSGGESSIAAELPICCPCGPRRRTPSTCGNFFDTLLKGKANTAHCLRFSQDWFHVFEIGRRSLGFNVRIQVKKRTKTSEVVVGPANRTALSNDNFLRVHLFGDFVGYTSIPSFEDLYLVIPRQGSEDRPQNLGRNFSMWMLLERVRFTDGIECDKIGVSYEAFTAQPDFCSGTLGSCLHNQLRDFWHADQYEIENNLLPQYRVEGRFERINEHPGKFYVLCEMQNNEALNMNLLIELRADDIEYVYQRSPGKIISVTVLTFEALTQFGTATITTRNIGTLEASYSITFLDDDDVALYFLPSDCESSKERYIHFLKMIDTSDLAIRCHFKGQTLVPYLWGVLCHPSTSIPASRNGNPRQRFPRQVEPYHKIK
ncbi:hypothetical protein H6P81_010099 [Aristolochia fimbriata]|uniref:Generative cell specific-1/HAP2 domain-containing protein n=1 Tax=Aristolochia fimbriata TaxID=158543 RepID=A0AAV7ENP2_ARIFI|nr:hypothetical protein H6P81_010099 [Aristolochia fimbriata]